MTDLDIYIKNQKPFQQFVTEFNKLFLLNLEIKERKDRFLCQYYCLDIEFLLFNNHNMEDDMGITFSEYDFCLSLLKINRGGSIKEYDDLYTSMARYYAIKISSELNSSCLVIEDSQKILMTLN